MMKNIVTFEHFCLNETSNWKKLKKGAAIGALSTGLALSGPQARATEFDKDFTRQDQETPNEFSIIVERPGKSAAQIKIEIYKVIENHQKSRAKSVVRGISYNPSNDDEIFVKAYFAVTPKGIKGLTMANIRFKVKDGKFKIIVDDVEFVNAKIVDPDLETELRLRFAPVVGSTIGGLANRYSRGRAGGVVSILANMAAASIQDIMVRNAGKPKGKSFKIGDKRPKSLSKKVYDDYLDELEAAFDEFFALFSFEAEVQDDF